jgi:long-chain acyl-CoA synthetase
MVSGGAPLSPEVGSFFAALGITVLQGYGQTEAGPVISCNRPAAGIRMDSVGPPLRETEVVIADDGEILVNGELVMLGYWRDEAATEAALRDGWLHTGDIGRIDDEGHLVITDRKKDIIINDKGENVAPQRIEGMLTLEPEISQAMVYGDRRPYLVAVIVPAPEYRMEWAARHGRDMQTLDRDPEFARSIQAAVDRVNARLAAPEKVRRIIVASEAFSVENGQTTPSLKLKRDAVRAAYGARLDALYR